MLRLARECEIKTAESRIETVGGKDVLLVKRFDREKTAKGYTRARMVSGLTILRADEAPEARQNWSYLILVEELRRIVENAKNILSQHARFLLDKDEAEKIVNNTKARVEATWYETLRASGVSEKDAETIRGAFVYPGFSL